MAVSIPQPLASNVEPKSPHVSDPTVRPFLQPDFDPVDFLNSTLPQLSIASTTARGRTVPLPDLSSQLQALLSQLNTHTTRLSNTLTQLTDEIIRSGSRLAYEVEVLRGETLGLTDAFENNLKKDIELFAPVKVVSEADQIGQDEVDPAAPRDPQDPEFLVRLTTLTTVRSRLDSVIQTFGSAMQWPIAPSELSVASSFISVSGPDSNDDNRTREERGKEYAERLRAEVNDLLASGTEGVEAANARVEGLRTLAEVWKGTAEEKARGKFVEALQKLVDDKQKAIDKAAGDYGRKRGVSPAKGYDYRYGNVEAPKPPAEGGSGYGFLKNLRSLKSEMYLE